MYNTAVLREEDCHICTQILRKYVLVVCKDKKGFSLASPKSFFLSFQYFGPCLIEMLIQLSFSLLHIKLGHKDVNITFFLSFHGPLTQWCADKFYVCEKRVSEKRIQEKAFS